MEAVCEPFLRIEAPFQRKGARSRRGLAAAAIGNSVLRRRMSRSPEPISVRLNVCLRERHPCVPIRAWQCSLQGSGIAGRELSQEPCLTRTLGSDAKDVQRRYDSRLSGGPELAEKSTQTRLVLPAQDLIDSGSGFQARCKQNKMLCVSDCPVRLSQRFRKANRSRRNSRT